MPVDCVKIECLVGARSCALAARTNSHFHLSKRRESISLQRGLDPSRRERQTKLGGPLRVQKRALHLTYGPRSAVQKAVHTPLTCIVQRTCHLAVAILVCLGLSQETLASSSFDSRRDGGCLRLPAKECHGFPRSTLVKAYNEAACRRHSCSASQNVARLGQPVSTLSTETGVAYRSRCCD